MRLTRIHQNNLPRPCSVVFTLGPCFLDALKSLNPDRAAQLELEQEDCDPSEFLNESLFDALNDEAPPYFYFGSHPGDGADYAFWLSGESLEEFDGLKVGDLSEVPDDYSGEILLVNDHGNTSLYAKDEGSKKVREIWAIV